MAKPFEETDIQMQVRIPIIMALEFNNITIAEIINIVWCKQNCVLNLQRG